MIVRLKADCQNCGLPADDQPQAFTVAAIHQASHSPGPAPTAATDYACSDEPPASQH